MKIFLRYLVIPYFFISFFFFGIVQLQYAILGKIVLPSYQVKIIGFVALWVVFLLYLLTKKKVIVKKSKTLSFFWMYVVFIFFDMLFLYFQRDVLLGALIYGMVYFYFYVVVLIFMLFVYFNSPKLQVKYNDNKFFNVVTVIAIPIFLLGFAQFILNDPILFLGEEDAYQVQSYVHLASLQTRAFSIFSSGYQFGHFITLVSVLSYVYFFALKRVGQKLKALLLFVASAFAIYSTYTRNSFLEFALSVFGVYFVAKAINRGVKNAWIIISSFGFGALVFFLIILYVRETGLSGVLDPGSFLIRMYNQVNVINTYFVQSTDNANILLGYGLMQGMRFSSLENIQNIIIDNTFINLSLYSGVLGCIIYIVFFLVMFNFVLDQYRETKGIWWQALSALYFSYPLVAAINIYVSQLYLMTNLILAYHLASKQYVKSEGSVNNPKQLSLKNINYPLSRLEVQSH